MLKSLVAFAFTIYIIVAKVAKKSIKKTTQKTAVAKKAKYVINRTPIVAVMGHVDHGKTSLLDAIKDTDVQASEAGGITQNTRAHQITFHEQKITFIDTPGHEAFSDMRSRGAEVTDIVLLVVAADDGVQPQTRESIKFALAAKTPMIVAINKIDLPGKNEDKLKQELSTAGLLLEEYGGDVMVCKVSAKKKTGLTELLESILLTAEMSELKKHDMAGTDARGFVLESKLDKTLGAVSLVIMQAGQISEKSVAVYGDKYDTLRSVLNEKQEHQLTADEGDPVWILGIKEVLPTGEILLFVKDEKTAKEYLHKQKTAAAEAIADTPIEEAEPTLEDDMAVLGAMLNDAKHEKEIRYLNVVVKTDSQGTLEAVSQQLEALNSDTVKIKVISSGTGKITTRDVSTAKAAHGIVLGFQSEIEKQVEDDAKQEKVLVRNYNIIYELLDEIADVLDSMEKPVYDEVVIAKAKIKKVFTLTNGDTVAGSEVLSGNVIRGYKAYVDHKGERVGEGKIVSLKILKNEVKEVSKGKDCGIILEPKVNVEEGDEIVCFKLEKV